MRIKSVFTCFVLVCSAGLAKQKSSESSDKKVYKNTLHGYEIKTRSCDLLSNSFADDINVPLERLSDLSIESKCAEDMKQRTFVISLYDSKSPEKQKKLFEMKKAEFSGQRNRNENVLYVSNEESERKYNAEFFYAQYKSFKGIRWYIYKSCNFKLFEIRISTKANVPADSQLVDNIKSGKELIPEPERSFIESFKCIN